MKNACVCGGRLYKVDELFDEGSSVRVPPRRAGKLKLENCNVRARVRERGGMSRKSKW